MLGLTLINMLRKPFFGEMFLVLVVIAVLHTVATIYFWYWRFFWFDILMHFLGGLWVALMFFWLLQIVNKSSLEIKTVKKSVLAAVLCAFMVGIFWEIFENVSGVAFVLHQNYVFDTLKDLGMDMLGGFCAGLYAYQVLKPKGGAFSVDATVTIISDEK